MRALHTHRPTCCSLPNLCSARTVEEKTFILGRESMQTHGTPTAGINSCPWHRLQLPTKNKIEAAKGRPTLHPTTPRDNQLFVVLFSAGSRGTLCSRTTFPVHSVLHSVVPPGLAGGGRQGRSTDGTFSIHHPFATTVVSCFFPTTRHGKTPEPDTGHVPRAAEEENSDSEEGRLPGQPGCRGTASAHVPRGGSEMGKRSKLAQEEVSSGSAGHAEAFLSLLSDKI